MKATCEYHNHEIVVTGDLNFSTVAMIWKKTLPWLTMGSELRFDLSKVTSANSAAISLLLEWVKFAKDKNKPIYFIELPESIVSLAEICGVRELIKS